MKSVSFLKSWKVKVSKTSKDDEGHHLPLQHPIERAKEYMVDPRFPHLSPASSSAPSPPMLLLAPPFKEDFSSSVEAALQEHRGTPELRQSSYPHNLPSRQNDSSGPFIRCRPTPANSNGVPLSSVHSPYMNLKHGPASNLQTQPSHINSSTGGAGPSLSYHSSPRRSQTSQRDLTATDATKLRSPTRVKFDAPSESLYASPRRSQITSTPVSNKVKTEAPVERYQDTRLASVSPTGSTQFLPHGDASRFSQQRDSILPKHGHPMTDDHTRLGRGVGEKHPYRSLTSSRSTPHLRPVVDHSFDRPPPSLPIEVPSSSDVSNFTSLFPAPPPLVIRKKRPQPLVLNPPQGALPFPPKASPIPSSADSTPVATPQSSRTQFVASTKSPRSIPPLLHDPPTSPLPPPPSMLSPPATKPVLPPQSTQSLKPSRSASNLRRDNFFSNVPTHRMTSSDPIPDVPVHPVQDRTSSPLKLDANSNRVRKPSHSFVRKEERALSTQEGQVHWGYAL